MRNMIGLVLILLIGTFPASASYYVATTGNDTYPGTKEQPFKTVQKAYQTLNPGDTAYVMPGDYTGSRISFSGRSGQEGKLLHIFAYDINNKPLTKSGISFSCTYVHLRGFELTEGSMSMTGSGTHHNIVEFVDIHNITGTIGLSIGNLAHDNLVLSSDFHDNVNFTGSNADGLVIWGPDDISNTTGGYNNTVRYCRSYFNNDDGYDTWCSGPNNRFENCWSFGNGRNRNFGNIQGDGNGFKLGQGERNHPTVINCLAWKNKNRGFDENANQGGGITVLNCTAYDNGADNFGFWTQAPLPDIVKNCVSYTGTTNLSGADDTYNNWNLGINVTANDFLSVGFSANMGPRKPDGSLPESDFLKPRRGSKLIDAGTNVGLPFQGTAPDLGAYEYSEPTSIERRPPLHAAAPTPFTIVNDARGAAIRFYLPVSLPISICLYNYDGKRFDIPLSAGARPSGWNIIGLRSTLPMVAGSYLLELNAGITRSVSRIALLK